MLVVSSTTKINTWRETWRKGGEEKERRKREETHLLELIQLSSVH